MRSTFCMSISVSGKNQLMATRLLISIYEEQADYQKINEILLTCNDENIVNQFQKYVALPPEFSLQDSIYIMKWSH